MAGGPLLGTDSQAFAALRFNGKALDASFGYQQPEVAQELGAEATLRFVNSETSLSSVQLDTLLRSLQDGLDGAVCIGLIATCIGLIATCIRLIATCTKMIATCTRLIATCIRLIATCIRLIATCIRLAAPSVG